MYVCNRVRGSPAIRYMQRYLNIHRMGSGGSVASKAQVNTKTPLHEDQNRGVKPSLKIADFIHGKDGYSTGPEKESKVKMNQGTKQIDQTILDHTGKGVTVQEQSTNIKGEHKTMIDVTAKKSASSTETSSPMNRNRQSAAPNDVQKSHSKTLQLERDSVSNNAPSGQPKQEKEIIRKLKETLKRHDDGTLQEKLRLMEWLEEKMKSLNGNVDFTQINVHTSSDVDEGEMEQNTDADWSKIQKEIGILRSEKQDLLNIVSQIAGSRLKHNNPAIADLSDKNRASKLAERFSELYDNEWTDVVEVLRSNDNGKTMSKDDEEELEVKCISFMVDLVKETYRICREKAKKDLDSMVKLVVKSPKNPANVDVLKRCKDFIKLQMSSGEQSLQQVIKSVGKKVDKIAREATNYSDFYKTLEGNTYYSRYRDCCVELCWYMCLQDPPVVMMADITDESTKDHFRAYTRSGKYLDFVVWPALLLHERGPLLYKGVAQYTNTPKSQEHDVSADTQF